MGFQLVRASDTDIAVWETEQGHVFVFEVCPEADGLRPLHRRPAPEAPRPIADFAAEALAFATAEAQSRQLIGLTPRPSPATRGRFEAV